MRSFNRTAALLICSVGIVAVPEGAKGLLPDPALLSGAAADTCFDCKDVNCDYCPRPAPCRAIGGYCRETVRNVSQVCVPRTNGQWENCKWRVDPAGDCVVQLLNPCTPERPICTTPIGGCGPLGICIPEGVCIP